jgi:hypothetical protein
VVWWGVQWKTLLPFLHTFALFIFVKYAIIEFVCGDSYVEPRFVHTQTKASSNYSCTHAVAKFVPRYIPHRDLMQVARRPSHVIATICQSNCLSCLSRDDILGRTASSLQKAIKNHRSVSKLHAECCILITYIISNEYADQQQCSDDVTSSILHD